MDRDDYRINFNLQDNVDVDKKSIGSPDSLPLHMKVMCMYLYYIQRRNILVSSIMEKDKERERESCVGDQLSMSG